LIVLLVLVLDGAPSYPVGAALLPILLLCGVEGLLVDLLGVLGQVVPHAVRQVAEVIVRHLASSPKVACRCFALP
jgi:hypothetical protein